MGRGAWSMGHGEKERERKGEWSREKRRMGEEETKFHNVQIVQAVQEVNRREDWRIGNGENEGMKE